MQVGLKNDCSTSQLSGGSPRQSSRARPSGTSRSGPSPISRRLPATFHMKTQDLAPLSVTLR